MTTDNANEPPTIGITESREEPAALYAEAIEVAGGKPMILDLSDPHDDALFDTVHGLLLTGGADVDPTFYGEELDPEANTRVKRDRDPHEFPIIHGALERDLPIFAICRGMQALNVALGGKLVQHIPNHSTGEPNVPVLHDIFVPPGSRLTKIIGVGGFMRVNSLHHQGVTLKEKAPGMLVSAYSLNDGIIEALDMPSHTYTWVVGVQWHPERRDEVPRHHRYLFSRFVDAAREHFSLTREQRNQG